MVEFEFGLVRFPLFGLEVDRKYIFETWIKIIKVTLDNKEISGSAIQFSYKLVSKAFTNTRVMAEPRPLTLCNFTQKVGRLFFETFS